MEDESGWIDGGCVQTISQLTPPTTQHPTPAGSINITPNQIRWLTMCVRGIIPESVQASGMIQLIFDVIRPSHDMRAREVTLWHCKISPEKKAEHLTVFRPLGVWRNVDINTKTLFSVLPVPTLSAHSVTFHHCCLTWHTCHICLVHFTRTGAPRTKTHKQLVMLNLMPPALFCSCVYTVYIYICPQNHKQTHLLSDKTHPC